MSYTRGTFAALVDAVVPETPALADRGDEHVPGGLAVDLDAHLVEAFGDLTPGDGGDGLLAAVGVDVTVPTVAAVLLDLAAIELLVRRRAEGPLRRPDESFAAGPFSRLDRRDRLRAVRLLETDGLLSGSDDVTYLAGLLVPLTHVAYYSDWGGDEQGWAQAGYPGSADGYAVSMGYEVETFGERDWTSDDPAVDGAQSTRDGDGDGTDADEVGTVGDGGAAGTDAAADQAAPDEGWLDSPPDAADEPAPGDDWSIEDPDPASGTEGEEDEQP